MAKNAHFLITRIDNIGDVVLSLPVVGLLKQHDPSCSITLLARNYTKPLADACNDIDNFVDWEKLETLPEEQIIAEFHKLQATCIIHLPTGNHQLNNRIARLAKKAEIPQRIGKLECLKNWIYCNKLVSVRKRNSKLHEAQLNIKFLKPLGIIKQLSPPQLVNFINLKINWELPSAIKQALDPQRFNLILHPGSHGHGREWPVAHFKQLIHVLPQDKFKIFLTGSEKEQERFHELIDTSPQVHNMMGKMSLEDLMAFISRADGLIASGTGPLHIAAALGINTLGLFPPRASINPQRWAPVGMRATYLVHKNGNQNKLCHACNHNPVCQCMANISVNEVLNVITVWQKLNV